MSERKDPPTDPCLDRLRVLLERSLFLKKVVAIIPHIPPGVLKDTIIAEVSILQGSVVPGLIPVADHDAIVRSKDLRISELEKEIVDLQNRPVIDDADLPPVKILRHPDGTRVPVKIR